MYVDAICKGIDDIPTVDAETRQLMLQKYEEEGLEQLCAELPFIRSGILSDRRPEKPKTGDSCIGNLLHDRTTYTLSAPNKKRNALSAFLRSD